MGVVKPIIDISAWQKPELINYDKLSQQISGAILRAAYGTGAPGKFEGADPSFAKHYAELHKRGVPLGAYHYITEYQPIDTQARLFVETVKGKDLKLGYWCDVELEANAERLSAKSVIRWMELVEGALGECGIYTGRWCWRDIMGDSYNRFQSRALWMAAYVSDYTKYIPPGWEKPLLWQYTSEARLDGFGGNLDANKYMGADAEYQKWIGESVSIYPKLKHPLKGDFRISQLFGMNPSWYPTSQGHNGIDWATPVGTPVHAMQDGTVIRAADFSQPGITDGKVGYGRHVRIQHQQGVSIYGHFSRLDVKEGDVVKAGDQLGLSGGATSDPNSGLSTGAHLHAEYRMDGIKNPVPGGYVYNAIDILKYIKAEPVEESDPLYKVRVIISNLVIRSGAGTNYPVVHRYASGTYEVYEEKNGYGRIGAGRWISLNPAYVEKVTPTSEDGNEPTDAEKLAILWDWYKGQE